MSNKTTILKKDAGCLHCDHFKEGGSGIFCNNKKKWIEGVRIANRKYSKITYKKCKDFKLGGCFSWQ